MKSRLSAIALLAGILILTAGTAHATNITINDGRAGNGTWYGDNSNNTFAREDHEVEPGMQTGQKWDLEGFYLDGNILSMVGGYNFKNGESGNGITFTSGDIFDEFAPDEKEGNIFNQSEEEILKFLLEKSNVRNRKQLEYLAGQKQVAHTKLKFTLHPFFGFLFTLEGERMNHFVWELLNSHATYIWSAGKGEDELALQYRRVEDAINQVRNSGREQYKQAYRISPNDPDLIFNVIVHENVNSPFIDGFVMWRHRLNELIV